MELQKVVDEEGFTVNDRGTIRSHPAARAQKLAFDGYLELSKGFGIGPYHRQKLKIRLFNYDISPSTQNKLEQLNCEVQDVTQGNTATTNVDYYAIEIVDLPDIDNDGSPETMDEVFEEIRTRFLDLGSGTKDQFQSACTNPLGQTVFDIGWDFVPYNNDEAALWESQNPLNTVLKIDAWASGINNLAVDNGAVIISELSNCCWLNTAISTPVSGSQPFSGHRQFGYSTNTMGQMVVYTKAIDRAHVRDVSNIGAVLTLNSPSCTVQTYYDIADATWRNFQKEVKDFVNDKNGVAFEGVIRRAFVDYERVYELLQQNEPITEIPCN